MSLKKSLIALAALLLCISADAQEIVHYTTTDGLSGTDVSAICADENYLWVATNDGLNFFDGKTFRTYRHGDAGSPGLAENNIETLCIDSKGMLWIGLKNGGADVFDPRMKRFTHVADMVRHCPQRVASIFEDSRHNIWLGSWDDGLYQLIPDPESEGGYRMAHHYPSNTIVSMVEKPAGKLWLGTYYGYFLYDIDSKRDIPVTDGPHAVTQLLDTGEKNALWMSSWSGGLRRIEWNNDFTDIHSEAVIGHGDYFRIIPKDATHLYLASWGDGLKIFDTDTRTLTPCPQIPAHVVLSFFRDSYNKLWIGSYGMGLYCLNNLTQGLESVPLQGAHAAAYTLASVGGNSMLVGTLGNGLQLFDRAADKFTRLKINAGNHFFHDYVWTIYKDENLVIIGHDGDGISYAPAAAGKLPALREFLHSGNFGKVTAVFRDNSGTYWMGTKQFGLFALTYDAAKGTFMACHHYDIPYSAEITGLSLADDGTIWVACHSGLFSFDPATGRSRQIAGISNMIYTMINDTGNRCLWLGTSGGICRFDYDTEPVADTEVFAGMVPRECIRDMVLDSDGNLWFSTTNRIFCYTNTSRELREINLRGHVPHTIYSAALCTDSDRESIVFGCDDRMLFISPHDVLYRPNHTKILLTGISINHRPVNVGETINGCVVLDEAPEYTNSITISYLSRWIDFSFVEAGWDNYKNSYQYRIKGVSDDWSYFDLTQPLSISQLNPGKYQLALRPMGAGLTDDGQLGPEWVLDIIVTPPWWRSTWFYVLLAITAVALVAVITLLVRRHYHRTQAKKLEEISQRKKEEILQEKENFFAGLSHDLLTSFALIIAPVTDLIRDDSTTAEQKEKLNIVLKNAESLSDQFKSILDYKRSELLDMNIVASDNDLVAHIRMMVSSFEYMAAAAGISLAFNHDGLDTLNVCIDRMKFERILYNLIGNAVKYSRNGDSVMVSLALGEQGSEAVITVSDTGIGIPKQNCSRIFDKFYRGDNTSGAPGVGLGLYITRRFVEAMNGSISVESDEDKGTVFTLVMPVEPCGEPAGANEHTDTSARFSVLLVEDNTEMAAYLQGKLSRHFDVAVAANGEEALETIRTSLPELVISDVMMPRMGGLELCTNLKSNPVYADIFVILLSAKSSPEDEAEGYAAGADFYLRKPFDPDALIAQVKNLEATCRQRRKQLISMALEQADDEPENHPHDYFITKAVKTVEAHLMDENFKVDDFAAEMNMSKAVLNRKFKHLVGETPNSFVRKIRLNKAAVMLVTTDCSISEIAYMTGFGQTHYFIKKFKEIYNETPGNYRQNHRENNSDK